MGGRESKMRQRDGRGKRWEEVKRERMKDTPPPPPATAKPRLLIPRAYRGIFPA